MLRALVKDLNFIIFFICIMLANVVSASYLIVFMAFAYNLSPEMPIVIAIAPLYKTLASAIIGVIAGLIIDKVGATKAMIISVTPLPFIFCFASILGSVYMLYLSIFLISMLLLGIFRPANNALLPSIVTRKEMLLKANALIRAAAYMIFIIVPGAAGALTEKNPPSYLLYSLAGMALILTFLLFKLRRQGGTSPSREQTKMFLSGVMYLCKDRSASPIFFLYVAVMLMTGGMVLALNLLILQELRMGIAIIGILTSFLLWDS